MVFDGGFRWYRMTISEKEIDCEKKGLSDNEKKDDRCGDKTK